MRVLVTGATGFLGRHVVAALVAAGHELMGIARSPADSLPDGLRFVTGRMGGPVPSEVSEFSPEVVVHLAWEGIPDFSPERCRRNRSDQEDFLAEMLEGGSVRRVVAAGTCREYGASTGPGSGRLEVFPTDDFGWAKDGLHQTLRDRCRSTGVDLVWFRIFYLYGPGQRPESLIPSVLGQLVAGGDPVVGNPDGAHDFVHVDDVASAFVAAVESEDPPLVADLGRGRLVRVGDVLEVARAVVAGERPAQPGTAAAPEPVAGRIGHDALGWRAEVDLPRGIRSMLVDVDVG